MSRIFVILAVVIGAAIAEHHAPDQSWEVAQDISQSNFTELAEKRARLNVFQDMVITMWNVRHPWLGNWKSTGRQENWEAFQTALQVPMDQHGNDEVFHKLWKESRNSKNGSVEHFHHRISVPSKNYTNEVQFKLGEEGTSNFNNTEFKYKYTEEADGLHTTFTIPSKNKIINDVYKVKNDELEKIYTVDDVFAKKWYSRVTNA